MDSLPSSFRGEQSKISFTGLKARCQPDCIPCGGSSHGLCVPWPYATYTSWLGAPTCICKAEAEPLLSSLASASSLRASP